MAKVSMNAEFGSGCDQYQLAIQPTYPVVENVHVKAKSTQSEAEYTKSYPTSSKYRRTWNVAWENLDGTTKDVVLDFLLARYGPYEGFTWRPGATGAWVRVHLKSTKTEDLTIEQNAYDVYTIRATLEELF